MWISMDGSEVMPMWAPPTPPTDDNDIYIDFSLAYLYEPEIMDPSRLPPVYTRKELKRTRKESTHVLPPDDGRRPPKIRKEETIYAPRSLFDRPSPALAKFRRDWKLQKVRGIVRPPVPLATLAPKTSAQPLRPAEEPENVPEWLVHEEWTLLQAVQNLLELPLNLVVLTPGHTPNWDLVSDLVNSVSRTYRSPKQCRNRYISVILPREEGKVAIDTSPKKLKKTKSIVKMQQVPGSSKTSTRPMRTSQLFVADNNTSFTSAWHQKFEVLKSISNKRTPTNRSLLGYGNSAASAARGVVNPKHASVLQDAGISYDAPLNPVEVAALRAERIAQKQKTAAALAEPQQQQQPAQQRLISQNAKPPSSPATSVTLPPASPIASRLTPIPVGSPATSVLAANLQPNSASPAASAVVLGPGNGQQTLLLQNATLGGQQQTQQLVLQTPVRAQQRPLTATSQTPGAGTATVVSMGLTVAQAQAAAQMLASAGLTIAGSNVTTTTAGVGVKTAAVTLVQTTTTTTSATTAKTLTPTQLQYLKQQQLLKQQQQRLTLQDQQGKKLQLATAAAAVTTPPKAAAGVATTVTTASAAAALATVQIPATALTQQQGQQPRAQLVKAGPSATLIRGGNPTEVAALLKRQQLQKAAAAAAAASGTSTAAQQPVATVHIGNTAQLLAQAGLQVQTAPAAGGQQQVAALVKTVSAPANLGGAPSVTIPVSAISMGLSQVKGLATTGIKQGATTPQQFRQIAIQQQLLQQRKVQQPQQQQQQTQQAKAGQLAQSITLGAVKGSIVNIPAQQLVSTAGGSVQIVQPLAVAASTSGGSGTPISTTVTMQQLQQVVRQVTAGTAKMLVSSSSTPVTGTTVATTSLIAKTSQAQTVQGRMIPVSQQALKQTVQVIAAGQTGRGTTAVAPSLASAIASGKLKVHGGTLEQQRALLSQVSAALQSGQPVSLALKNPNAPTTRIYTTIATTTTASLVLPNASPTTTAAAAATAVTTASTASTETTQATQPPPADTEQN